MPPQPRRGNDLPLNGQVLTWARRRKRLSLKTAASKIGASPEQLRDWEEGQTSPTVSQARKLAKLYKRSFLEFFRPSPPPVVEEALVPDFRYHREPPDESNLASLKEIQEWAESVRRNALDLFELTESTIPLLDPSIYATVDESAELAAARVREHVGFPISQQLGLGRDARNGLVLIFREALEAAGVLVLRTPSLAKLKARGLCVFHQPLPVIVFSQESPSAQLFTLAHEFGHIALRQSAISGNQAPRQMRTREATVERWCNSFAAAFLVPADHVRATIAPPITPRSDITDDELQQYAGYFGVSPHAMLIRLVELDYVQAEFYWDTKRKEFIEQEKAYQPSGRAKYYGSRYRSAHGDLYTGLVLEAWGADRITNHTAAEFLGIQNLKHLEDIRAAFLP